MLQLNRNIFIGCIQTQLAEEDITISFANCISGILIHNNSQFNLHHVYRKLLIAKIHEHISFSL